MAAQHEEMTEQLREANARVEKANAQLGEMAVRLEAEAAARRALEERLAELEKECGRRHGRGVLALPAQESELWGPPHAAARGSRAGGSALPQRRDVGPQRSSRRIAARRSFPRSVP